MIVFSFYGHVNLLATHRNTIELTKYTDLTKRGDCIIGVKADFDASEISLFANNFSKAKMIIQVDNILEEVIFTLNKDFKNIHELVIRRSNYNSDRTLGMTADKAAYDINRKMVEKLKNPLAQGKATLVGLE
jgi:hypothetical protein